MEQPAALCGVSLWLAPLGFPRGEAVSHDGSSEPAGLTDEGVATTKKFENSKLNGKTGTNAIHIVAFVNQPVATPHQSFLPIGSEAPLVKKSSFPPGDAQRRLRELIPFNVPIHSGNGGWLRVPIIYKLFTHAIVLVCTIFLLDISAKRCILNIQLYFPNRGINNGLDHQQPSAEKRQCFGSYGGSALFFGCK